MKISFIKQMLGRYDAKKGYGRAILGDAEPIDKLRKFYNTLGEAKEDRELTKQEMFNLIQLMLQVGYRYVKPVGDKFKYGSASHDVYSELEKEISRNSPMQLWIGLEAMYQTVPSLLTFENYNKLLTQSMSSDLSWINLFFEKKLLNQQKLDAGITIPYFGVQALWRLNRYGLLSPDNLDAILSVGDNFRVHDLLNTLSTINYLNQDTFNIITRNLNYAVKITNASYFPTEGCSLGSTSSLPSYEKLDSVTLDTRTAYLLYQDRLFYVSKFDRICNEIKLNADQRAQLNNQLKLKPGETIRLSEEQLKAITTITGHTHVEKGFTKTIFDIIFQKIPEAVILETENYLTAMMKKSPEKAKALIQAVKEQGVAPIWKDISKQVSDRLRDALPLIENTRYCCGYAHTGGVDRLLTDYASCVDTSQLSAAKLAVRATEEKKAEPSGLGAALQWLKGKTSSTPGTEKQEKKDPRI